MGIRVHCSPLSGPERPKTIPGRSTDRALAGETAGEGSGLGVPWVRDRSQGARPLPIPSYPVTVTARRMRSGTCRLAQELKRHEWDFDGSDDERVARGRAQAKEIRRLFLVCDRDKAERLWRALAPDDVAPPDADPGGTATA
jgi:hypothetical protein